MDKGLELLKEAKTKTLGRIVREFGTGFEIIRVVFN